MIALLLAAAAAVPLPPKVAVVTGASSGIGRALAEAAAERGWRVVLADKDPAGSEEAALAIRKAGGTALVVKADVALDADRGRLLEETVKAYGGVDLLVNNAGYGYMAATERVSLDEARRMFEVNYFAAVDLSRRALALMRPPRAGTVVNVASVLGLMPGLPESGQYAAAKHALVGWARSSRAEFKRAGVRFKLACPAGTKTGFFKRMQGPDAAKVADMLEESWEDFDAAPKVARDILDGLEAPGLFLFPGRAREVLPPALVADLAAE